MRSSQFPYSVSLVIPLYNNEKTLVSQLRACTDVLNKVFKEKEVRLSRIAHGVPIGSDIDYIDDRTMGGALENRVEI